MDAIKHNYSVVIKFLITPGFHPNDHLTVPLISYPIDGTHDYYVQDDYIHDETLVYYGYNFINHLIILLVYYEYYW